MKGALLALGRDLREVAVRLPRVFAGSRRRMLVVLVLGAVVTIAAAWLGDRFWAEAGRAPFGNGALPAARALSYYGELHWIPLFTAAVIWIAGRRTGRIEWRRAAVASLLAAVVAGLVAAMLKGLIGRARPDLETPFAFFGPNLRSDTQGFPSGHSTHSVAFAATLLMLVPELGIPALIIPAAVVWARLAMHKHYPSDIAGGATLGLIGAVWVAAASRLASADARSGSVSEEAAS